MSCCVDKVQASPLLEGVPVIQSDPKHRATWKAFGLDGALYDEHLKFAEFLFKTKLIFSIVGYQETMGRPASEAFPVVDGKLCILIEKKWRDFDWIEANLYHDPVQEWFHAKGSPKHIYTYLSPCLGGLNPKSRHYYENVFPVHELNEEEMASLRKLAGAQEGEAIYQLVSTPRPSFSKWIIPVHISERIITSDGTVYSFGAQPDPDLAAFIKPEGSSGCTQFFNGASTGEGVVAMSDYEEFLSFEGGERLVTTLPISGDKAMEVLKKVDAYKANNQFRFNMLHQNCAKVGVELTKEATGVVIDNKLTALQVLFNTLPEIPLLSTAFKTMKVVIVPFWEWLPECFTKPCEMAASIIFFIPSKMATFLTNLIILILGGYRQADDLEPENDNRDNQHEITQFSRLIKDFTDLFREHPSDIYHHVPVIQWQRQHPKTIAYQYEGKPKMFMLPPLPALPLGQEVV